MANQSNNNQEKNSVQVAELKSSLNFTKTFTDRLAVFIIDILGSIPFLLGCILVFVIWICWNTHLIPGVRAFDPFPFSTLQMAVSIFAIILSVSVLINQNRQGRMDKIREHVEFEVNVRAEHEITTILSMVHEMYLHIGLTSRDEPEIEEMKVKTNIEEIQQTIDENQNTAESLL